MIPTLRPMMPCPVRARRGVVGSGAPQRATPGAADRRRWCRPVPVSSAPLRRTWARRRAR